MLLRYFVNLYDMEIIEEEAFLSWKEDVTEEYPGKGKALFQVTGTRTLLLLMYPLRKKAPPFLCKCNLDANIFLFNSGEPMADLAGDS